MKFYDLHVHSEFSEGESSIEEIAERAKILGYSGICFAEYFKNFKKIKELKKKLNDVSKRVGIEIYLGFEARDSYELSKLAKKRKEFDILLVRGGELNLNRKAVETKEVDVLTHPEFGRKDSGLNHVMARLANENNVAIEINFREIVSLSKTSRSLLLKNIQRNIMLCRKYGTPLILSSGAISHWHLKDPKVLISMACVLGLEIKEAKNALSQVPGKIIQISKERQDERWIMPGVKVIS